MGNAEALEYICFPENLRFHGCLEPTTSRFYLSCDSRRGNGASALMHPKFSMSLIPNQNEIKIKKTKESLSVYFYFTVLYSFYKKIEELSLKQDFRHFYLIIFSCSLIALRKLFKYINMHNS